MHISDYINSPDLQITNLETQTLQNRLINYRTNGITEFNPVTPYLIMIFAVFTIIYCLLPALLWKTISIIPSTICQVLWCCTCQKNCNKKPTIEERKDEKEQKLITV